MKTLVRIAQTVWDQVVDYHNKHKEERLSFLRGQRVQREGREIILINSGPLFLADDCYIKASETYLKLEPTVAAAVLNNFMSGDDDVLVNIHSHPFSKSGTTFSAIDDRDDIRLDKSLRRKFATQGRTLTSLSIVLDQSTFDARVTNSGHRQKFSSVDEVQCIGHCLQIFLPNSSRHKAFIDESTQRHDFVGTNVLNWMRGARAGVAGAGGLGSCVSEALVRLGFRDIVIVDDDTVEATNLNRLQGVGYRQVGKKKVHALQKNIAAIAPGLTINVISNGLNTPEAVHALSGCDLLFGGLDNALARALLNQIAVQYFIPLFDAGVCVDLKPTNFLYRTVSVIPGITACMMCSRLSILNHEDIARAMLSPALEAEYRARGYISNAEHEAAPSVYPLNLMASGGLMTECLNYLAGFRSLAVLTYSNFQESCFRRIEHAAANHWPSHDCIVCTGYFAKGDAQRLPYLNSVDKTALSIDDAITEWAATLSGKANQQ